MENVSGIKLVFILSEVFPMESAAAIVSIGNSESKRGGGAAEDHINSSTRCPPPRAAGLSSPRRMVSRWPADSEGVRLLGETPAPRGATGRSPGVIPSVIIYLGLAT